MNLVFNMNEADYTETGHCPLQLMCSLVSVCNLMKGQRFML